MRIRKNVRLSSFMRAESIKPYRCQLNQSPWDVIDFSGKTETNFHQFGKENSFTEEDEGLGNFSRHLNVGGGIASLKDKMEKAIAAVNVEELGEKIMRCGKPDNDNELLIEKMEETELSATARARRSKCRPTSGQDEFYYYSGFGPNWGKKRVQEINDIIVDCEKIKILDANQRYQNQLKSESDSATAAKEQDDDDESENGSRKRKKSVTAPSLQCLI